jgi:hypothetical protein
MTLLGPEKFHRDMSSPVMRKYMNQVKMMEGDLEKGQGIVMDQLRW